MFFFPPTTPLITPDPLPPQTRSRIALQIRVLTSPVLLPLILSHCKNEKAILLVSKQFNTIAARYYYIPRLRQLEFTTKNQKFIQTCIASLNQMKWTSGLAQILLDTETVMEWTRIQETTNQRNIEIKELQELNEKLIIAYDTKKTKATAEIITIDWIDGFTLKNGYVETIHVSQLAGSNIGPILERYIKYLPSLKIALPHLNIERPFLSTICSSPILLDAVMPLCTVEISQSQSNFAAKLWILNVLHISTISVWLWGSLAPLERLLPEHVIGRHLELNLDSNEDQRAHNAFTSLMKSLGTGKLQDLSLHTFADDGSLIAWQMLLYQHRKVLPPSVGVFVHYDFDDNDEEDKAMILKTYEDELIGLYDVLDHPEQGAYEFIIHLPKTSGRYRDIRTYFLPRPRKKRKGNIKLGSIVIV